MNQVIRKKEMDALRSGNRKLMKETADLAWRVFEKKREEVLQELNGDWDIFMVHFYILDPLQHLYWYDHGYVSKAYEKADKTVEMIKDKMKDVECLLLIVSDHGHKKGVHTPHGFYSCNRRLKLINPKITDFAEALRSCLGLPSREEELKIYRRLKSLGYA